MLFSLRSMMAEYSAGMNLLSLLLDSVYFLLRWGARMTDLRSVLYL
jgi:hypothetical protein